MAKDDVNEWGLNVREEEFCIEFVKHGNASEAYRVAFKPAPKHKQSIHEMASKLLAKDKVSTRILKIRRDIYARRMLTLEDLLEEYEEAREIGKATAMASAMVAATTGKAKLLGLDKQVTVIQGPDGKSPFPSRIELVAPDLEDITRESEDDEDNG